MWILAYFHNYRDGFVSECDYGCGWAKSRTWYTKFFLELASNLFLVLSLELPLSTVSEHSCKMFTFVQWFLYMEYFPYSMSAHQILLIFIGPGQMLPHAFFSDLLLNLVIYFLGLILHCIIVIYTHNRLLRILHEELNCMSLSSEEKHQEKSCPYGDHGGRGWLDNIASVGQGKVSNRNMSWVLWKSRMGSYYCWFYHQRPQKEVTTDWRMCRSSCIAKREEDIPIQCVTTSLSVFKLWSP